MTNPVGVAIVGCGYIADAYRHCLPMHAQTLRLCGAYDRDAARLAAFRGHWGDRAFSSLDELLADPAVSIVINATDPQNHAPVTRAALDAGKHVYSEKPLAMTRDEAADFARPGCGERPASWPPRLAISWARARKPSGRPCARGRSARRGWSMQSSTTA